MAEVLKMTPQGDARPKTKEELWAYFERKYLSEPIPFAKPKPPPTVTLEVPAATAERVRLRPESVRLSTVREDGVPMLERARPKEIVHVLEVDGEGRPKRARVVDGATGEAGYVDYAGGYRQSGVVSDWNPLDALKRD
jgi:hypothetical protein